MRYNFGEMKIALAVLAVAAKGIGESLRRFVKYAPRFCADVVRDIKPAWEEFGDVLRRKERPRFSAKLLPLPGERNKRESDLRESIVNGAAVFFAGIGIGGMLAALLLKQLLLYGWVAQAAAWLVVVACGALALALEISVLYRRNNYYIGYVGERKVGEELEKCAREYGGRVFHGFQFENRGGDIDHVFVCKYGVASVETKALRSREGDATLVYNPPPPPMDGDSIGEIRRNGNLLINTNPLEQNKNNARDLRRLLRKRGFGNVTVLRVVFFPEWEVTRTGKDKFEFVCGANEVDKVGDFIRGDGREKLTDDQVEKITAFLDENLRKDTGESESPIETAHKGG